ncbi:hypothetical protein NMG60_11030462 [Bertholletia excelsa]
MGFPVGYTEFVVPKFLLHTLFILGLVRKLISSLLRYLGLGDFLEPENSWPPAVQPPEIVRSVSASLVRELLPVARFSELDDPPESCAVCLYEFTGGDEVRRLPNCPHIFHRSCVDRWMDHGRLTCPLCRTRFVSEDFRESINEGFWEAAGLADFAADEYLPVDVAPGW